MSDSYLGFSFSTRARLLLTFLFGKASRDHVHKQISAGACLRAAWTPKPESWEKNVLAPKCICAVPKADRIREIRLCSLVASGGCY